MYTSARACARSRMQRGGKVRQGVWCACGDDARETGQTLVARDSVRWRAWAHAIADLEISSYYQSSRFRDCSLALGFLGSTTARQGHVALVCLRLSVSCPLCLSLMSWCCIQLHTTRPHLQAPVATTNARLLQLAKPRECGESRRFKRGGGRRRRRRRRRRAS